MVKLHSLLLYIAQLGSLPIVPCRVTSNSTLHGGHKHMHFKQLIANFVIQSTIDWYQRRFLPSFFLLDSFLLYTCFSPQFAF